MTSDKVKPVECDCCGGTWGCISADGEHDNVYDCVTTLTQQRDEARWERNALELSLAKKAESYRLSVLAAEAETKQWKEFFYGQCDKAERMERVVREAFFEGAFLNGPGATEWEWESTEARKSLDDASGRGES